MRILVLQHVPFEGPAAIADWASRRGHPLDVCRLYAGDPFPVPMDFDRLVVMGGPMGVGDTEAYQAFLMEDRVLGLQCHLESTPESVRALCDACGEELLPGRWVQTAAEMRAAPPKVYTAIGRTLETLLDRLPA